MSEMFSTKQFKEDKCQGHYKDLVSLLVYRKEINYEEAISRLSSV